VHRAGEPLRGSLVEFDQTMIKRAMNDVLGCSLSKRWLDIEPVPPVRWRQIERPLPSAWIDRIDIEGGAPL